VSNYVPEHKLAQAVMRTVTDRLFNHPNFGWQMRHAHPIVQQEFFEAAWAFINTMADLEGQSSLYIYDQQTAQNCLMIREAYNKALKEGGVK
jgi:hypothetical protein